LQEMGIFSQMNMAGLDLAAMDAAAYGTDLMNFGCAPGYDVTVGGGTNIGFDFNDMVHEY